MASELFAKLTDLVDRGDTAGCVVAVKDASNAADLKEDSDEILALVVHSDLQICDDFDELVSAVAVAGSAKTNLLSLLGGFSSSNEAPRVSRLFPAVATTLTRIPEGRQRDKMVAFALSKSVSYLKRLSEQIPEMPRTLSGKERAALDAEPSQEAVMDYASDMEAELISPLVSMITTLSNAKLHLVNALTHIFRFAFVPCNMHKEGKHVPRALALAEKYLARLRSLNADPVKLLAKAKDEVEDKVEDEVEEDDDEAILSWSSRSGVGVMVYAIYAESVAPDVVPSCYDPLHVYVESMGCMSALCEAANYALLHKGLLLSAALLSRIGADSVGHDVVDSERFGRFLAVLVRAVTYCDNEEFRRLGFETVSGIHSRLRFDAETKFFLSVTESKCHSGLKGWVVSKLKDLALKTAAGGDPDKKAALFGPQFKQLCLRTFRLERGAETDVLQVSDEVMAALSFLYCLKSREAPGSEEILSELRPMFLSELERGLEMARGHYEMQLAEVAAEAAESGEVSVIVSGQRLPQMGREEMRDVVSAALNTIDLMEMSLARLKSLM